MKSPRWTINQFLKFTQLYTNEEKNCASSQGPTSKFGNEIWKTLISNLQKMYAKNILALNETRSYDNY